MLKKIKVSRNLVFVGVFALFLYLLCLADSYIMVQDITKFSVKGLISVALGAMTRCLFLLAPLCLAGKCSKWFYYPFVVIDVFFLMIGLSARVCFKLLLDGMWVGIVLGSSPDEMSWFLRQYAWMSIVCVIVGVGVICLFRKVFLRTVEKSMLPTRMSVALGVLILAFFGWKNNLFHGVLAFRGSFENQMYVTHFVLSTYERWGELAELAQMKTSPWLPDNVRVDASDEIGVIVLGESATRSRWGLYGYNRDTTPCMDARRDELIVFSDLVTPAGTTDRAMRYIFTTCRVGAELDLRFTMAQVLNKAGLHPMLYSNQERWADWCGDESFDFAGCESLVFMNEQGETNKFDDVLMPYLQDYLQKNRRGVCFLHLIGSHEPAFEKYPHDGAPFDTGKSDYNSSNNPQLGNNHYDNSIWYTDKILEQIVCKLETLHRPCWMAYFSDHGETPSAKGWRTMTDRDLWDVPFVIWTSKEFVERHSQILSGLRRAAQLPLQSDQLLYGLLTLSGVEGVGNCPEEDFLNEKFVPRAHRMICNGAEIYAPDREDRK